MKQAVEAMTELETARQVLRAQPFSRLIEAELLAYSARGVELRLPITEQVKQQNGFVHGGVLSYAADNALTFAGGTCLGPNIVTSGFKINYLRPARGEQLAARAHVVHAGRSQAVCRCDILVLSEGEEVLCAVAQGTISLMGQAR